MSDYVMDQHPADAGRPHSLFGVIEAAEPEVAARLATQHAEIAAGRSTSTATAAALAMASAPIALAALAHDAYGQATTRLPAVVITVLNFALTLEYLESGFYTQGVGTAGLIPAADRPIFTTIQQHEAQHVTTLQQLLGASARPSPAFDFTAHGAFPDVFSNYATFKAIAQAFEDTGVRAYKGQAPALIPYKAVLTAALSIHSVEARHASEIRRLRGGFQNMGPFGKGWITGNQTDIPGTSATYAGEDNVMQGGVDVSTLIMSAGAGAASEAFDEPLTMQQVLAIAGNFIAAAS
ncbi:MAG TPA: ferritin-like domain-containing protein [Gemmatirosa sp.]